LLLFDNEGLFFTSSFNDQMWADPPVDVMRTDSKPGVKISSNNHLATFFIIYFILLLCL